VAAVSEVNAISNPPVPSNVQYYAAPQNWAEAVAEIKRLLQEAQLYPTQTAVDKLIAVLETVRRIESNASLKSEVVSLLRQTKPETLKNLIDNPLSELFLVAVKDW
jgi:negative regulator of replication initiation